VHKVDLGFRYFVVSLGEAEVAAAILPPSVPKRVLTDPLVYYDPQYYEAAKR
jgi:hypothetical protein